jgi:hypothetical protein
VLARRDKKGFETPADLWLRGRYAGEARRRLLSPGPLHEWLDRDVLAAEFGDFLAGRRSTGLQVWRWLSLEAWARRWVAGDPRLGLRPEAEANAGAHRSYVERARELRPVARGPGHGTAAGGMGPGAA